MLEDRRRHALILLLLLVSVGIVWGGRFVSNVRLETLPAPSPQPAASAPSEAAPEGAVPSFVYFVDVEGWYRVTPYERAVSSSFDLSVDSTDAIAASLPSALGEWTQLGSDISVADDPAIVTHLNHPTVALQRAYRDPSGQTLTLVLLGNIGPDSYLLFSHTPETCYPGRLWSPLANRRESANLAEGTMYANYILSQHAQTGKKQMVLYWYLWDSAERDPQEGVLSVRVNLFVPQGQSEEAVLARAWDFVRILFPTTVRWDRF